MRAFGGVSFFCVFITLRAGIFLSFPLKLAGKPNPSTAVFRDLLSRRKKLQKKTYLRCAWIDFCEIQTTFRVASAKKIKT